MLILFTVCTGITALLHCLFFKIESIDFMKRGVLRRFGLSQTQGETVRIWALNQGFYNLFLALGLFYSLYLMHFTSNIEGKLLAQFILLSLTGAGIVLGVSSPKKYAVALFQGAPAFIGFVSSFFI
jgi:putative membrane protein